MAAEKDKRLATGQKNELTLFFLSSSSGKIKVKVVTSREVLENMDKDDRKDVKLLSKKEETQFKDLILNLLVSFEMPRVHSSFRDILWVFLQVPESIVFCSLRITPYLAFLCVPLLFYVICAPVPAGGTHFI